MIRAVIRIGLSGLLAAAPVAAQDMRPAPRPEPAAQAEPVERTTVVMTSQAPMPRPPGLLTGQSLRRALSVARQGEWDTARAFLASGTVEADIIEWQRLRSGRGTFDDYRAFLTRNGDWPGLTLLRKRGEATIPEAAPASLIVGYFSDQPPQTGYGALQLAAALAARDQAKSRAELLRAWTTLEMTAGTEAAYLAAHGDFLKPHHARRLDDALWREDIAGAQRMMALVGDDWKALARARLALQRRGKGVNALIGKVPAALQDDPGLAHDRMTWRVGQRLRSEAADLILEHSGNAEQLGRPDAWANWRRILARQEMRAGNARRAYDLAHSHHLKPGSDYADLEWLSGYLALRNLDKPEQALTHFRRFRAAVYTPISLGRAGYWEGRALEAMGQADAAQAAYTDSARHQTSFYGLLAAEKAGLPMDPALTGNGAPGNWQDAGFAKGSVFQAAELFFRAGQPWETVRFLRHLAESLAPQDLILLADYTLTLGDPFLAVQVGKQAAREGTVAHRAYYPVTDLGPDSLPVPRELALSIARRESEFRAAAVSGAGARGLMQLMPATAQSMSKKLGLSYSRAKLTSDPTYNARLGSAYLAQLIEEFGNNIVLVSVGYNAGPGRSRSWIKSFGDPRDPSVDAVDWIEHIPFRETRNYVMRVAESLPVYRARLTGKVEPIRLSQELGAK